MRKILVLVCVASGTLIGACASDRRRSCPEPAAALVGRPVPAPLVLPPGCERIADGLRSRLSPSGRRLGFVRWEEIGGRYVYGLRPLGHGGEPLRADPWILDLESRREWRLPWPREPRPSFDASEERIVAAWRPDGAVLLDGGSVVDAATGEDVTTGLVPPRDAHIALVSWSHDGKRLAYARGAPGEVRFHLVAERGMSEPDLVRIDAPAWSVRFDSGTKVVVGPDGSSTDVWTTTTDRAPLRWPPERLRLVGVHSCWSSAGHLYFEASLRVDRHFAVLMRTGIVRNDGSVRVLSEVEGDSELPGRTPVERLAPLWDSSGSWFVWVRSLDRGRADVYVSNVDSSESRRVTDDQAPKWAATIDPAARRVAFYVRDLGDETWPGSTRIRVVDLRTGESVDHSLALPEGKVLGLTWTADGTRLLYDRVGEETHGVFAQSVPRPRAVPANARILRKPDPPTPAP